MKFKALIETGVETIIVLLGCRYDFIGSLDTFPQDMAHVLQRYGNNTSYPKSWIYHNRSSTAPGMHEKYYNMLTKKQIVDLANVYASDFAMFGYEVPSGLSQ